MNISSNRNRRRYGRVRLIADQFKILVAEAEDIIDVGIDPHLRRWQGFPGQLLVRLVQVVQVQVGIAQGVHELARRKAGDLGHHQGEQGVGGDVEGFSDICVFCQIASGDSEYQYHKM